MSIGVGVRISNPISAGVIRSRFAASAKKGNTVSRERGSVWLACSVQVVPSTRSNVTSGFVIVSGMVSRLFAEKG